MVFRTSGYFLPLPSAFYFRGRPPISICSSAYIVPVQPRYWSRWASITHTAWAVNTASSARLSMPSGQVRQDPKVKYGSPGRLHCKVGVIYWEWPVCLVPKFQSVSLYEKQKCVVIFKLSDFFLKFKSSSSLLTHSLGHVRQGLKRDLAKDELKFHSSLSIPIPPDWAHQHRLSLQLHEGAAAAGPQEGNSF